MAAPIAVLTTGVRLPDDATELGVDVSRSLGAPLLLIDGRYGANSLPTVRHRINHLVLKREARQAELARLESSLREEGTALTVLHSDGMFSEGLQLPGLAFIADPRGREWPRRDPFDRLQGIAQTVVLVRRRPPRRSAVIVRPIEAAPGPAPDFIKAMGLETVTVRVAGANSQPDPIRKSMDARGVDRFVGSIKPSFVIVEGTGPASKQVLGRLLGRRNHNVGWVPAR
jgi:hypothetical protein